MDEQSEIVLRQDIENRIFSIRGIQIMIDHDLAEIYQVETKRLNEQVRRNKERFPLLFRFQLSNIEKSELVANCDRLESLKHSSINPYAFTEQGVAMISAVLRSETAVKVSIQIMNAFVVMRKMLFNNAGLLQRLEMVENKLVESDLNFEHIFQALESNTGTPKQNIFYNGQIYDAYSFIIQLIEKAEKEILLIDNYISNSVLDMLSKKKMNVKVHIITLPTSKLNTTDIEKFNQQYPFITISHSYKFHDRFLLIDKKELYHIGASLKDLGKKCFAFSRIEEPHLIENLLNNIRDK